MLRGIFVTGTDTGVGKTVLSAALMHRYRPQARLRYWKPIQTGIEHDDDTREVTRLGTCKAAEIFGEGIRLPKPLSPHVAAERAHTRIEVDTLLASVGGQPEELRWIVEGAGGILVPINETELMVDLIGWLGLPVVIAARSGLGTINHTLLSIEALRNRNLDVAAVVMIGPPDRENRAAIERHGCAPVIGELPKLKPLSAATLRRWAGAELDPEGQLLNILQ